MPKLTVGFIGFGLIGGSIARALKANPDIDVSTVVYDVDRASVTRAFEDGIADVTVGSIGEGFSGCDFVFLCAPVTVNMANAETVAPFLKEGAILTDVGSVKGQMHERIRGLGLSKVFIGGHPMAGSERVGYANSKEKLLVNAYYVITADEGVPEDRIEAYKELVAATGAIPLVMTPERHDYITAAVSHVPHVISASLVNLVKDSDTADGDMHMIAAGGFKDITRISSSSPMMWHDICVSNSGNICVLLDRYIASLTYFRDAIKASEDDELVRLFDGARRYRDTFQDSSKGPIKSANVVHVEIPDEPGALAIVFTILSARGINIKNVGIVHNREVETGSLSIELHDETAVRDVYGILTARGYDATIG